MMDKLVAEFPAQLREALEIGKNAKLSKYDKPIHSILTAGLGGSGIGANYCIEFTAEECTVPYSVTKGYSLPAYVNENTLVICSSYSGNTEETLYSFEDALKKNAKIVVVASGGKLLEKARALGIDHIEIPGGKPSPRACLGYSFVQQLFILKHFGFISDKTINEVAAAADFLDNESADIKQRANMIANAINNKTAILYSNDKMESVVVRLRQQLNENSKVLCWHHVFPEMCHNELVGWREQPGKFAVLMFRNADDFSRTAVRMDITKEIFAKHTDTLIEIWSKGNNMVERSMYFTHLGDWVSVSLSELRSMDNMEVKVIDYLKAELGKL